MLSYMLVMFHTDGMLSSICLKLIFSIVLIAQGLSFPTILAEDDCGYLLSVRKLVAFCYLRI